MAFVQFVEADLVVGFHDKLLGHSAGPELSQQGGLYMNPSFYCRVAASFNKASEADRPTAALI